MMVRGKATAQRLPRGTMAQLRIIAGVTLIALAVCVALARSPRLGGLARQPVDCATCFPGDVVQPHPVRAAPVISAAQVC